MTLLHTLPSDHPLRNSALGEIGAETANTQADTMAWKPIEKHWAIARKTFNELSGGWIEFQQFRA